MGDMRKYFTYQDQLRAEESEAQRKLNNDIDEILKMVGNRRIKSSIEGANELTTEEYKRSVAKPTEKQKEKRKVKSTPNKENRFSIPKKIIAAIIAGGIAITGTAVVANEVKESIVEQKAIQQEQLEEALLTLKQRIAESIGTTEDKIKVFDASGDMSSVSEKTEIIVEVGSQKYTYYVEYVEGKAVLEKDQIKNKNIVRAIQVIATAKDGNKDALTEAVAIAEAIKQGKFDVGMRAAVAARAGRGER